MRPQKKLAFVFTLIALLFASSLAGAASEAARVLTTSGVVESLPAETQTWQGVQPGATLEVGDSIRTGADGGAALLLADESIVRMNRDTVFVLHNVGQGKGAGAHQASTPAAKKGERSLLGVIKGELWFLNKNPDEQVDIKTRAMTASLRGTEFDVRVEADGSTQVTMLEGTVQVWNEQGAVVLNAFEVASVRPGFAPQKTILLTPENSVQWTVLIPQLLNYEVLFRDRGDQAPVARLRQAWEAIDRGELSLSRDILLTLTEEEPNFLPAWESLALNSLVLNDTDAAIKAVERAEALAPNTPFPLMLRSLIDQARFDLVQAEEVVRRAVDLDPNNLTAQIQLATLLFGRGATDEAAQVVATALRLAPGNAYANSLWGFIQLTLRNEDGARQAFARASQANPALADPHLGLGIIAMRHGDEEHAMAEVTSAVLLEPRRALLRSYWAKMLYQLGRHEKALDVLQVSQHIDPHDPTPDLYRALILRDLHQPGAAIIALNEAIRKNDFRAVYRSRLLLDQDLAVKNVDLSLIYTELGLDHWAMAKAVDSLAEDYANASAHLFYAGSLTGEPGRSWSRNTENLLARLLMSANVNTFNTFNDYTAFFERPSLRGEYNFTAGSHDTLNQDILTYGALPQANLAFQAGYLPYRTDGWREDLSEESRSAVGFIKWDPTPKQGLMFSASRSDSVLGGALEQRFNFDALPQPQDDHSGEVHRLELGYTYAQSPATHLLLHAATVRDREWIQDYETLSDPSLEIWQRLALSQPYSQLQGEVLHRYGRHQFLLGSSYYRQDGEGVASFSARLLDPPIPLPTQPPIVVGSHQELWSTTLHDRWQLLPSLTVEMGLADEVMTRTGFLSEVERETNELSPRFGLLWKPQPAHTIHLAAFRSLMPFYADYLVPADIAGVPILRNGAPGTMTNEADLVWDYELGGMGLISASLFTLESRYEVLGATAAGTTVLPARDSGGKVVFESLLGAQIGMALSYQYDDITNEQTPSLNRADHQLRASLRWIGQQGLSSGVTETNRLDVFRSSSQENENMYLTDFFVGYEFPGRQGGVKFEVNNLFDEHCNWLVDTFTLDGRAPAREALFTVSLRY